MTEYTVPRALVEASELKDLVADQSKRFDEIIERQKKEAGEFIENIKKEAIALHNKHCPNPPGSPCGEAYLEIHLQAWMLERGMARLVTPEEFEQLSKVEEDEERRYL